VFKERWGLKMPALLMGISTPPKYFKAASLEAVLLAEWKDQGNSSWLPDREAATRIKCDGYR